MKYPPSVVSLLAILGNPAGTIFPILWLSWMTASVYGMFGLSAMLGWRDCPITLSISAWTFSGARKQNHDHKRQITQLKEHSTIPDLPVSIHCDWWDTDPAPLGSSSGTRGSSAKWWQRFLFQPRSGPGCKHSGFRCWSQPGGPAFAVNTEPWGRDSVSWSLDRIRPLYVHSCLFSKLCIPITLHSLQNWDWNWCFLRLTITPSMLLFLNQTQTLLSTKFHSKVPPVAPFLRPLKRDLSLPGLDVKKSDARDSVINQTYMYRIYHGLLLLNTDKQQASWSSLSYVTPNGSTEMSWVNDRVNYLRPSGAKLATKQKHTFCCLVWLTTFSLSNDVTVYFQKTYQMCVCVCVYIKPAVKTQPWKELTRVFYLRNEKNETNIWQWHKKKFFF